MKVSIITFLISFCLLFSNSETYAQSALDKRLDTLLSYTVPVIKQDELARILANKNITLLDTRTQSEYDVSHLKGAKFIDYDAFAPEMVAGMDKNEPVVVYCSVGYRSEKIGEKLKELGFSNVQNLYGGIFEWKNHDHVVVNDNNTPTDSVHVYDADWGQYLHKGIKIH
ncbi:MAG: rhodanese-like domain-containing protein [Cyclobacteriaceae bacterium]|nr:rhodanese-like domain-containing protein [Cyclobacteriaceae bacterium]